MNNQISGADRGTLRELAKLQLELASTEKMRQLKKDWIRHIDCNPGRPMVVVEWQTFEKEVIPSRLRCTGELARSIERDIYANFIGHQLFDDDSTVKDYLPLTQDAWFVPFGITVSKEHADGSVGHHFAEHITDLERDFHLLQTSTFGVHPETAKERKALLEELVGDILPVRIIGGSLGSSPTQDLVHIMSMETMLFSIYDYPEHFHKAMQSLADDYIRYFEYLEDKGFLLPSNRDEHVSQGSYAYTDDLPGDTERPLLLSDVWGYMDSQETSGVSPDMFDEFIFPYYKQIGDRFGLLSYGCCEAVDPIWEKSVSTFSNLRRVSISPWCNEEYMGERLRSKRIVYHRKPSPNYIGVSVVLDEDEVKKHISKTVRAARGCTLEFTQRDVYTVHNDMQKVRRYVELIRQCAEA